jgi:hypothetical protein
VQKENIYVPSKRGSYVFYFFHTTSIFPSQPGKQAEQCYLFEPGKQAEQCYLQCKFTAITAYSTNDNFKYTLHNLCEALGEYKKGCGVLLLREGNMLVVWKK